ncbi:MAG: hypothetical protein ACLUJM_08880 [Finegoldia sp.]|uniref:hypothetical protein n=1 Tax=Finegoldia sp. TaxID=1981334 RepID=UPI003990F9E3
MIKTYLRNGEDLCNYIKNVVDFPKNIIDNGYLSMYLKCPYIYFVKAYYNYSTTLEDDSEILLPSMLYLRLYNKDYFDNIVGINFETMNKFVYSNDLEKSKEIYEKFKETFLNENPKLKERAEILYDDFMSNLSNDRKDMVENLAKESKALATKEDFLLEIAVSLYFKDLEKSEYYDMQKEHSQLYAFIIFDFDSTRFLPTTFEGIGNKLEFNDETVSNIAALDTASIEACRQFFQVNKEHILNVPENLKDEFFNILQEDQKDNNNLLSPSGKISEELSNIPKEKLVYNNFDKFNIASSEIEDVNSVNRSSQISNWEKWFSFIAKRIDFEDENVFNGVHQLREKEVNFYDRKINLYPTIAFTVDGIFETDELYRYFFTDELERMIDLEKNNNLGYDEIFSYPITVALDENRFSDFPPAKIQETWCMCDVSEDVDGNARYIATFVWMYDNQDVSFDKKVYSISRFFAFNKDDLYEKYKDDLDVLARVFNKRYAWQTFAMFEYPGELEARLEMADDPDYIREQLGIIYQNKKGGTEIRKPQDLVDDDINNTEF